MIERVISFETSSSYLCVKTILDPNPKTLTWSVIRQAFIYRYLPRLLINFWYFLLQNIIKPIRIVKNASKTNESMQIYFLCVFVSLFNLLTTYLRKGLDFSHIQSLKFTLSLFLAFIWDFLEFSYFLFTKVRLWYYGIFTLIFLDWFW